MAKSSNKDSRNPQYYYEISNNEGDHYVGEVNDIKKSKSSVTEWLKKLTGGVVEPANNVSIYQKRDFNKAVGKKTWQIRVEKANYSDEECSEEEHYGEFDHGYNDLGNEEAGEPNDDGLDGGQDEVIFYGWDDREGWEDVPKKPWWK